MCRVSRVGGRSQYGVCVCDVSVRWCRTTFDPRCSAGARAFIPCVEHSSFKHRLGYCSEYVTWDITDATNATLESLTEAARLQYRDLLYQYRNSTAPGVDVPANCLAFQPLYACATHVPKCVKGASQPLCEDVCSERNWRCDITDSKVPLLDCGGLPDEDCSAAGHSAVASAGLAAAAVVAVLVATALP